VQAGDTGHRRGPTADDNISVNPADASGNLAVDHQWSSSRNLLIAGADRRLWGRPATTQIKAGHQRRFGPTTYYVQVQAVLFGDAGNDTPRCPLASTANNILIGGGRHGITLQGGSGPRILLIGGAGGDTLHRQWRDDLVIGNSTDFDANLTAPGTRSWPSGGRTDTDITTGASTI